MPSLSTPSKTSTEASSPEPIQTDVSGVILTQHPFQLFRVHGSSSSVSLPESALSEKKPVFSGLHAKSRSIFQPYQLTPEYSSDFTQN